MKSRKARVSLALVAGLAVLPGAALAQGAIKIGLIEPATGPAAYDGQSVINGAKLAAEEENATGGALGRTIDLIVEDGKADPAESLNAAEKLLDRDKVSVLIGAWASSATLAIMPKVEQYQVPLIVETSTSDKITEMGNPWVYRISSNSKIDAEALKPYLKKLGLTKVAFIADNNDYGRAVVNAWSAVLPSEGGTVVTAQYHKPGDTNFAPVLTKIKNSGANSIVITSDVTTVSNIVKQSYELGLGGMKRFSSSGNPAEAIIHLAGKKAAEGLLVQNYWVPYSVPPGIEKASAKFVAAYKQHYPDREPDKYATSGYDAVHLAAAAIKAADSAAPAKIEKALRTIKYQALQGPIEFDKQHQARPYQSVSQVIDGTPKIIIQVGR
jgi:branched-chain amino acid transport system substrate-binding protein